MLNTVPRAAGISQTGGNRGDLYGDEDRSLKPLQPPLHTRYGQTVVCHAEPDRAAKICCFDPFKACIPANTLIK